jgi:hypothetical protein
MLPKRVAAAPNPKMPRVAVAVHVPKAKIRNTILVLGARVRITRRNAFVEKVPKRV